MMSRKKCGGVMLLMWLRLVNFSKRENPSRVAIENQRVTEKMKKSEKKCCTVWGFCHVSPVASERRNHQPTKPMKTHDRIDNGAREYIPIHQNRTARQIQRDIDLMRLAYADRMNQNQHRRDSLIGWCLLAIGLALPVITALLLLLD